MQELFNAISAWFAGLDFAKDLDADIKAVFEAAWNFIYGLVKGILESDKGFSELPIELP